MISLRKTMDTQLEEVYRSVLQAYKRALAEVGVAGPQACPPVGEELRVSLLHLAEQLHGEASARVIAETEQTFEKDLAEWSSRAATFHNEKTTEIKEILSIVANAATQLGERDHLYTNQFREVTDRLQATSKLDDLSAIRRSLVLNVSELKTCVSKMAQHGEESVAQLRGKMKMYEERLEELERAASQDALTALGNRRMVERQLDARAQRGAPFSVLCIDLNGFKEINDQLGHVAGDDLLKQFANELRTALRSTDVVGRWGGDEFLVLVDGDLRECRTRVERIEQWVGGQYSVSTDAGVRTALVSSAIGVATWKYGDTPTTLLQRADAAMYARKAQMKADQKEQETDQRREDGENDPSKGPR
jgi:diguanylate cyclase (GGDEF)-like protein